MLSLISDVWSRRPGPVDPERCPVRGRLRAGLSGALTTEDDVTARAIVYAMHTHMMYGHPDDSRTIRPQETSK